MTSGQIIARMLRCYIDYRQKREVVRPLPIRLWVESSTFCNLKCVMCPNKDMSEESKAIMDYELFTKIVDEAKDFANDLYLHHRGEPFLNPRLCDMITYAREAGLRTRFHTNGAIMTLERADALLKARPNLVSFSVDGFEQDLYEEIRIGALFNETVENILYLAKRKQSLGLKHPYIVVERIRFRDPARQGDARKIQALKERFLAAGVNEVIEKDEYDWADDHEGADPVRTSSSCTFPWYAMVICADGTVTPCPQDFWAQMKMGNAREASLKTIWNDEPYRALRRAFKTDVDQLSLCRTCDRLCRKTVKGIPLQYAITFLIDQFVGYGRLRRLLGTAER